MKWYFQENKKILLTGASGRLGKTIPEKMMKSSNTYNVISLGYFEAVLLNRFPENIPVQKRDTIQIMKFGGPLEILKCIHYLFSDKSSYLTGQIINLYSGLY